MPVMLSDVACGLEAGDKVTYRNAYGQTFQGELVRLDGDGLIMSRPEWRRLGFGVERIVAAEYELVRVGW